MFGEFAFSCLLATKMQFMTHIHDISVQKLSCNILSKSSRFCVTPDYLSCHNIYKDLRHCYYLKGGRKGDCCHNSYIFNIDVDLVFSKIQLRITFI